MLQIISLRGIGRLRVALLSLLVLALLLDGLDVKLLSYAAPLILEDWDISEGALGPALAAVLVGMASGAWLGGWLGDQIGRRTTILVSVVLFGGTTVGCGYASDLTHLIVLRFLGGLGFGAVTPNAFALLVEWMPARVRGLAIGFISIASPLGGMIGATVALLLLPRYGWQACFIIVGIATLLAAMMMALLLPESPAFLRMRGRLDALPKRWQKMLNDVGDPTASKAMETPRAGIFCRDLARLNIGASLSFFLCQFVNYGIAGWLPVILTGVGLPLTDAITASLIYNAMAIVAGLLCGSAAERWGSQSTMLFIVTAMFASLLALAFILAGGAASAELAHFALLGMVGVLGACSGGFLSALYVVVSRGYPADRRSTGVGFGVMAGRIGGISTTIGSGLLLTASAGRPNLLFWYLAIAAFLMIGSTLIINCHVEPQLRH